MENILEEFECLVCLRYMTPPIPMCCRGHSICNQCDNNVYRCPICRQQPHGHRNLPLERMFNYLEIPCSNEGCNEIVPGIHWQKHQNSCVYAPIDCLLREVDYCNWRGKVVDAVEHYTKHHPSNVFNSNACINYPKVRNGKVINLSGKIESYHVIIHYDAQIFKCVWHLGTEGKFMRWYVFHIYPTTATRYFFDIIFWDRENSMKGTPMTVVSDCEIFRPESTVEPKLVWLHTDLLKDITGSRGLYYTVVIHKKGDGPRLHNKEPLEGPFCVLQPSQVTKKKALAVIS